MVQGHVDLIEIQFYDSFNSFVFIAIWSAVGWMPSENGTK